LGFLTGAVRPPPFQLELSYGGGQQPPVQVVGVSVLMGGGGGRPDIRL